MTPDLVIFDCDGVLVDSEPITNQLLRDDLATRGLDLPLAEIMNLFVGGTIKGASETAMEMGADLPGNWVETFYEATFEALARGTPLINGVTEVLDALDAARVPYVVASNGPERKMDITLGQHPGVYARLQGRIFSAHTVGIAKPDPGLYLVAAGQVDAARIAVVEDSKSGCIAARRAGMRCLGLAEHDDGARLAAEGAEVIHSLHEVPAKLNL